MGSSSSDNYSSSSEKSETTIEDETLSSSQESVPVPWLAGERKIAVKCDRCHKLDIPACVQACPTGAISCPYEIVWQS